MVESIAKRLKSLEDDVKAKKMLPEAAYEEHQDLVLGTFLDKISGATFKDKDSWSSAASCQSDGQ